MGVTCPPTFVLVHGAWHGAWCWDLLVDELARRGARAIAVDLPADDATSDTSAYARCVLDRIGDEPEVVLVGHSLGGLTIPLVAAQRPVRALVFLCALLPAPGRSLVEQLQDEPGTFVPGFTSSTTGDAEGRSCWADPEAAIARMYGDVDRPLAEQAVGRLRPQARAPSLEPCPLASWPDVAGVVIVAEDDRVISPAWAARAGLDRLGVEPIVLPGGHSPFLSRPGALAEVLLTTT